MKIQIDRAMKRARLLSVGGLLAASVAVPASGATFYSDHSVTFAGCLLDGTCFAGVSPAVPSTNTACAARDQVRWNGTSAVGQEWSRLATAALLAGKKITVEPIQNQTGGVNCNASYPTIDQLHIKQ